MTTHDPLKSVMALGNVDDTSLALPSLHKQLTGEQRVREQVQTVRRTKSRHFSSRSGSTSLSPTSPLDDVFVDFAKSSTSNGSVFYGNGYLKNHILEKNINRQKASSGNVSSVKTNSSRYHCERHYGPVHAPPMEHRKASRSEPDLVCRRPVGQPSVPPHRVISKNSKFLAQRSASQYITVIHPQPRYIENGFARTKMNGQFIYSKTNISKTQSRPSVTESTSNIKGQSGSHRMNGNNAVAHISMKEAVEFLSRDDEEYQNFGTSYIQHYSHNGAKAKEEVLEFKGIPVLIALMCSSSARVSLAATAALRNLSYQSNSIKEEIHRCGGITKAAEQLKASSSEDLNKQLTGLLWNLSSSDNLRTDLQKIAFPVLVERVLLPSTATKSTEKDADVFYHTTGFLQNLSSHQPSSRLAMRTNHSLIDSLVNYVNDCLDANKPDDLSLEHCVSVLHNLTYKLEKEAPHLFQRMVALSNNRASKEKSSSVGCFSSPSKVPEHEQYFDYPSIEETNPSGAGRLIHSKTLSSYLSLLKTSQRDRTLEACCGAMLNLTAPEGIISNVISHIIVKKLKGMQTLGPLLKSNKVNLQKSILILVKNLMKNPNLQSDIGFVALPELLDLVTQGPSGVQHSDDNLALACQIASYMITKEPEKSKSCLKNELIKSLTNLSNMPCMPKSQKAAGIFLYKIWSDKVLRSFLKGKGWTSPEFVNNTTMAAHRSTEVVH